MRYAMLPLLAAAALCLAGGASAASLSVTVVDKDGEPVPDAAVTLRYAVQPAATRPVPPPIVVVDQQNLRFLPYLSIVAPGTTVLFTNRDSFDHHVVATAPGLPGAEPQQFQTRLPPDPTKPFGVKVTEIGRYALSCHLHSRMRGYIYVTDTPWFGKTDAQGRLRMDNLPDGLVQVQSWHPEQFIDQVVQSPTLGAAVTELKLTLNFKPRTRRVL